LSNYEPIPCIAHEKLEWAVLKRQWLEVEVMKGERAGHHRLLPLDVYARDGAEWLEAQAESGEKLKLRLDVIKF